MDVRTARGYLDIGLRRLQEQLPAWERRQQYFEGIQDDPFAPDGVNVEYLSLQKQSIANWLGIAMKAPIQRMRADGIMGGDGKVEVWNWTPTNTSNNSAILFGGGADIADNASELGKTMSTALSGATLLKSEVYLHSKIVYTKDYQPGPTALGTLGATALPASKVIDGSLYVPEVPSGGGVWVEVPTAWFTGGANLGITVGDKDAWISTPGGAVLLPSMFINGPDDANPPRVRHTYTR